jgi:hypothetical protein
MALVGALVIGGFAWLASAILTHESKMIEAERPAHVVVPRNCPPVHR